MFTVSTPCFLSFWDFFLSFWDFFLRSLVLGVRIGFGGREGALASALIYLLFLYQSCIKCIWIFSVILYVIILSFNTVFK